MGRLLALALYLGMGAQSKILLSEDFSTVALGAGTVANTDLAFSRASVGHSVQTSATTLYTGSLAIDVPRYGSNGVARGLVLECTRQNLILRNREINHATWSGATGTFTYTSLGPDGVALAARLIVPSGALSRYQGITIGTTLTYAVSCWQAGFAGGETAFTVMTNGAVNQGVGSVSALTTAWGRKVVVDRMPGPESSVFLLLNNAGGMSTPVVPATARDAIVDYPQVELGRYPTEVIINGATALTRSGDRLRITNTAKLVHSNRVEIELDFYAKGASTEYIGDGTHIYLLYTDASNYIRIDTTSRRLEIRVAGSTWSPMVALSWARGDRLRFRIAAGGGLLATRATYKVNSGTAIELGVTSPQGTWPALASDILSLGTASQFSCWLCTIRTFKPGGMPWDVNAYIELERTFGPTTGGDLPYRVRTSGTVISVTVNGVALTGLVQVGVYASFNAPPALAAGSYDVVVTTTTGVATFVGGYESIPFAFIRMVGPTGTTHQTLSGSLITAEVDWTGLNVASAQGVNAARPTYVAADADWNNQPNSTFDGDDIIPTSGNVDLTGGYTVIKAARFNSIKDWQGVWRHSSGLLNDVGHILYSNINGALIMGSGQNGVWHRLSASDNVVVANTKYVLAATYNGATVSLRKNGAAVTLGGGAGTPVNTSAPYVIHVGTGYGGTASCMLGGTPFEAVSLGALTASQTAKVESFANKFYEIYVT